MIAYDMASVWRGGCVDCGVSLKDRKRNEVLQSYAFSESSRSRWFGHLVCS